MTYKLKNIKYYIPTLAAAILFNNMVQAGQDSNKAIPLNQPTPTDIINHQASYFDNYWNSILGGGFSSYESRGIKSKFITQDKQYIIIMEVPGFDKSQIKIKINANKLFITGNIEEKDKDDDQNNYINKNFNYVISLHDDIDQKNISSNLKNGILTITMPRIKVKEQDTREIPIN